MNKIGSGTVTSSPAGIDCGATCHYAYPPLADAVVELTATPIAPAAFFAGWSGACTAPSGTCTVTLDGDWSVTATFVPDDMDGDGLPNASDPDDDGDGMTDVWEQAHGLESAGPTDAGLDRRRRRPDQPPGMPGRHRSHG